MGGNHPQKNNLLFRHSDEKSPVFLTINNR